MRVAKAGEGTLPSSIGLVERLRERIRLLEAVVDNFPGGISLFDKDLRMVLCNEQGEDPDELLRKADHALYRCKDGGRGNFAVFELGDGPKQPF